MRIRTQFKLLIATIIIIPTLCLIFIPLHYYLTSSQRYLMQGYKQIRNIENLDISDDDWNTLEEQLKNIPDDVQVAVLYENKVLISTIEELPEGSELSVFDLFDIIHSTSHSYDYQMQSPLHRNRMMYERPDLKPVEKPNIKPDEKPGELTDINTESHFFVISRTPIPTREAKLENLRSVYIPLFLTLSAFVIFCIVYLIRLSRTISSSITILEHNTQRIAQGELDKSLSQNVKKGYSNEITSLTQSIEKMRQSLKEDQEKQSRFIMGISHDLRTPVALIKGYTEAISDGVVADIDSVKSSLDVIHTKADQLEGMINTLIDYVKLNDTDWRQTLVKQALLPLLEEFAQGARLTGEVYKRNIETDIHINENTCLTMDRTLVMRALENLFSNAVRYTQEGQSISIKASQTEENIFISVSDTGCGIQPKDLEHVWELFYRGTNSRREQGMGIGLSTVKNIIDTHGWNISVSSESEKGSTFTITIPTEPCVQTKTIQ
ncbi:MAG TPA: hypothetical protein DC014_00135 [Treponema sp.]|nr:hypothetical protein [Treponema sp.]